MNDKLVILGGGHGLSNILNYIKEDYPNLKAIVNCANSGGSTGKLRYVFNCPAMGDIRKCLTALSKTSSIARVFEYRTQDNDCVGNLVLSGLIKLYNFKYAINQAHNFLKISDTQRIIPISLDNYDIRGKYIKGHICNTEADFNKLDTVEQTWLHPEPKANPEALEAIKEADYIILAPGSFYTSVLVNLKLPEISDALKYKKVIWIANLMQEKYETLNCKLINLYSILSIYTHIDIAIVNNQKPDETMLKTYQDYLHPLTDSDNGLPITKISYPLIHYNNKTIIHNSYVTFSAIQSAIKELKK